MNSSMTRLRTANRVKAENVPPRRDHVGQMLTSLGSAVILQAFSDLDATRRELLRHNITATDALRAALRRATHKTDLRRLRGVYDAGWDAYKFLTAPDGAYAEIRNSWCQCAGISPSTLVNATAEKYGDIALLMEAI